MKKKISVLVLTALLIGVAIIPMNATNTTTQLTKIMDSQWPEPDM